MQHNSIMELLESLNNPNNEDSRELIFERIVIEFIKLSI